MTHLCSQRGAANSDGPPLISYPRGNEGFDFPPGRLKFSFPAAPAGSVRNFNFVRRIGVVNRPIFRGNYAGSEFVPGICTLESMQLWKRLDFCDSRTETWTLVLGIRENRSTAWRRKRAPPEARGGPFEIQMKRGLRRILVATFVMFMAWMHNSRSDGWPDNAPLEHVIA